MVLDTSETAQVALTDAVLNRARFRESRALGVCSRPGEPFSSHLSESTALPFHV